MRFFYDTEFIDDGRTIEGISIGIVREDGAEYYAVLADAPWDRIRANPWLTGHVLPHLPPESDWKPRSVVAAEVAAFLRGHQGRTELWAWFSAYDHVVLSQLYGRMLDMPQGIPHFTNDLRSLIDIVGVKKLPADDPTTQHDALADARLVRERFDYVMEQRASWRLIGSRR